MVSSVPQLVTVSAGSKSHSLGELLHPWNSFCLSRFQIWIMSKQNEEHPLPLPAPSSRLIVLCLSLCPRRRTSMDCITQASVPMASGWVELMGVTWRVIRAQVIKEDQSNYSPASQLHSILWWQQFLLVVPLLWFQLWLCLIAVSSSASSDLRVLTSSWWCCPLVPQHPLMAPLTLSIPLNSSFTRKVPSKLLAECVVFFGDSGLYTHFPWPTFLFHFCDYKTREAKKVCLGCLLLLPDIYGHPGCEAHFFHQSFFCLHISDVLKDWERQNKSSSQWDRDFLFCLVKLELRL